MAASVNYVLGQLQRWTAAAQVADLSDVVLLERYIHQCDETAFAALVGRYGTMVLRVCRRILGDGHHAEDAFQAAFLVLARKAHSLRQPDALAGWLHGVARRVALKARRHANPLCSSAVPLDETLLDPHPDPLTQVSAREVLDIVDAEVQRLPAAQRSSVVLCCLEGQTREEAARQLGWTVGSVKNHLQRGRQRLQERLRRRGIGLSAVLALVAVSRGEAASALLLRSTVAAAMNGAIGGQAAALAGSVLKGMLLGKLAAASALVLTVALTVSAGVAWNYSFSERENPGEKTPAVPEAPKQGERRHAEARVDAFGDPLPPDAVARLGSLRLYHGERMERVALSPDGKWVVSTAGDGNRLWDAASGREYPLRAELRLAKVFSTRDQLLAVQPAGTRIHLWNMAAGKEVGRPLDVEAVSFESLALSPDGKTLVLHRTELGPKNPSSFLRFCDLAAGEVGEPIPLTKGERVSYRGFAFSADGKTLAMQYTDSSIHIWDVKDRKEKQSSRSRPADFGGFFALSPDGTTLAAVPQGGKRVRFWDTRTLKELPPLLDQPNEAVQPMTFSPDGKRLAVVYSHSIVRLWDLATRKEVRRFRGQGFELFRTIFSADGKYLVAADGAGVTFWDVATGKYRHDFGHTYNVDSIRFAPDGRRLASGAAYTDNIVRVWNPLTGQKAEQLHGHADGIEVVAYAPDGKLLASGSQDGGVRLWDTATNREVRRLEANDGMVYAMAFHPDGKTLASGGKRKAVHLWDVATGREVRSFDNPGNFILRLSYSPNGKIMATRGIGETIIRLWDSAKGEQIRRLTAPNAGCPSLEFSPDGTLLTAGGDDGAVRLWDVASGEERRRLTVPLGVKETGRVFSVAFSPDGRVVAVGYEGDGSVRLWELASRQVRLRYKGHRGGTMSLAFSPDGTLLASGGIDRTILVWDVTGQRTEFLPGKTRLAPAELNALWNDLGDADAAKAYRALQTLLAAGERSVSFLKERLRPAAVDAQRIERRIDDLDSDEFVVRQSAEEELRKMGDDAESALRKVLAGKPSAEQRLRVKQLLHDLDTAPSPQRLRLVRAVEVLERAASPAAQEILKTLAKGTAHARLTDEAKAALERLARRERK